MRGALVRAADRLGVLPGLLDSPAAGMMLGRHRGPSDLPEVLQVARGLADTGRAVAIEPLPMPARTLADARRAAEAYQGVLESLAAIGLGGTDVCVRLAAISAKADPGPQARELLSELCRRADEVGCTLTVDVENRRRGTGPGLELVAELREQHPDLGVVLISQVHRSEADAVALAAAGGRTGVRVRLVRELLGLPVEATHRRDRAIDRAYVRCLRILMEADARVSVACHDPRVLAITADLVQRLDNPHPPEILVEQRIRPRSLEAVTERGLLVRTNLAYGPDWAQFQARRVLVETDR